MKRHIFLGLLMLLAVGVGSIVLRQTSAQEGRPDAVLLTEDFSYTAGQALTSNGWTAHSGGGTNPITVTSPGLTYTGYAGSGVGNAVTLATSGEDVNRTFAGQSAGSVYASVLVNVSEAFDDPAGIGGYVFHLGPDPISTTFRGRVFVKKNAANQLSFGISKAGSTTATDIAYTPFSFALNTTHLLIVKYTIVAGDTNDTVSLFVNPTLGGAEPAASVTAPDVSASDISPASVALRQGTAGTAPTLRADGIRVGTAWADVAGAAAGGTPTPTATATATPAASPTPTATATPSGSPTPGPGALPRRLFTTRLSGTQEVPANNSPGRGFGRVVLNASETQITASVYFENLTANTISGHIHSPALPGANAPVLFDMTPPLGVTAGRVVDKTFNVTPAQVADLRAGLWYFNIHSQGAFSAGEIRGQITRASDAPYDINGDGRTDFGAVRPTAGAGGTQLRWFNLTNATPQVETQIDFGVRSDSITPGDFDGDGKDDIAVWRSPSEGATFYILQSSTNTLRTVRFGLQGDDPFVIQDYDGDGVDDPAIHRKPANPGDQATFWWYGSFGATKNAEVPVQWGVSGDIAVPGDFNGDDKADFCVYRAIGGNRAAWFIHYGTGRPDAPASTDSVTRFGLEADVPVPGDWDGDGSTDLAVTRFEGAAIVWYVIPSSAPGGYTRQSWGRNARDLEVQGDYDGDGRTDYAVWRTTAADPRGFFYILRSSDSSVQYQQWGLFDDALPAQDSHAP